MPMGSIAASLSYGAEQKRARDEGKPNWRPLTHDGSKDIVMRTVHVNLSIATEIKKRLPPEGVRWLYARSQAKSIVNSRLDTQVLLFDEGMELVAIANHANQIIPAKQKSQKTDANGSARL